MTGADVRLVAVLREDEAASELARLVGSASGHIGRDGVEAYARERHMVDWCQVPADVGDDEVRAYVAGHPECVVARVPSAPTSGPEHPAAGMPSMPRQPSQKRADARANRPPDVGRVLGAAWRLVRGVLRVVRAVLMAG